jgi:hypothetical protein
VQAVVVKEVDVPAAPKQLRQLGPAVPDDQLPSGLEVGWDKKIMRGLAAVTADVDAVQLATPILGHRGEYMGCGRSVQHTGVYRDFGSTRPHQQVQCLTAE